MTFSSRYVVQKNSAIQLDTIDTSSCSGYDRERAKRKTQKTVRKLAELQYLLFANASRSLLIVLQGPDASGKDGLIKHLFTGLNPQGVKVTAFDQPTKLEARHDFLWRVHPHAPAKGEIAVFNRSHYEAVLVERVHKLVPQSEWEARYEMINSFEALLAQNGTQILKFYLHISAEEQLDRFRRRLDDKMKQWKISEDDYSDRKLWPQFREANEAMLQATSTSIAPWYVIPSNHKWFRNFAVSKIVVKAMKELNLKVPPPKVNLSEIREKYHAAKEAGAALTTPTIENANRPQFSDRSHQSGQVGE